MGPDVFSAFAKELEKLAVSDAMKALDTAGQLGAAVPGFGAAARRTSVPRAGSFGIKVSRHGAASDEIERMDGPSWKQTAKDMPLVIAGTGISYGIGKTVGEEIAHRYGKTHPHSFAKHAPLATAIASSIGSYAMGRTRAGLKARREEARERAKK